MIECAAHDEKKKNGGARRAGARKWRRQTRLKEKIRNQFHLSRPKRGGVHVSAARCRAESLIGGGYLKTAQVFEEKPDQQEKG